MNRETGIVLRPSTLADLDWVLAVEGDPEIEPYITRWPAALHEESMASAAARHLVVADAEGDRLGYAILQGIGNPDPTIELTRLVIAERGRGTGRAALRLLKGLVFDELGAHRLWLDVVTSNESARRLYSSEGFVEEGILREAARRAGGFASLVVMSILEHEYRSG
ncbi:MAG TPA: GNAT family protein [Longimicrobiales bacterium]|nr:GNAT family protein [Longimicrobiales bacterium]